MFHWHGTEGLQVYKSPLIFIHRSVPPKDVGQRASLERSLSDGAPAYLQCYLFFD